MEKKCTKCGEIKSFAEYSKKKRGKHGLCSQCKSCASVYSKQYTQANKQKLQQYRQDNKEKRQQYLQENKKKVAKKQAEYEKKRRANDPVFRMISSLRTGLWHAMNGTHKPKKTMELLGCSKEHLEHHLSAQFADGMTLENYGEWHVDHIQPIDSFDHNDPEQVKICWHYTNLQPLWGKDNIIKSNKIITEHQVNLL